MAPTASDGLPLSGVTVLELGEWIAVPFVGKLLADLGAEVTKIEWADTGDATRRWGPFPAGREQDLESSGLFAYLNTNKASLVVERGTPAAAVVRGRPEPADIILADQYFLGADRPAAVAGIRAASPRSVLVTVTPFGIGGPFGEYQGYDITSCAAGGISYGVGERTRAPLPLPFTQSDRQTALVAASAALMGLISARGRGVGVHADVSVQEVMAALHCGYFLPRYLFSGGVVGLRNGRAGGAQSYPHTVMKCKDGLVTLAAPKLEQWIRFLGLMGNPEWTKLPRYRNRRAMQWEYKAEVDALVSPWFTDKTKRELIDIFVANRIPFAPLLDGRDLAENEHLKARDALREYALPGGGSFLAPTLPYRFERGRSRTGRAPTLGEHGRAPVGSSPEPVAVPAQPEGGPAGPYGVSTQPDGETVRPPLAGLRVLDLGTAWAGGIAGRILGDFGADVIKIESWSHMDGSRLGKPIVVDDTDGGDSGKWPDLQPGFHVHGRSKRSVTLNLRSEQGMELLLRLVAKSDVLIHNFAPRVARSLGLAAERLRAVNDRLVVVGQSVAGVGGPLSEYTGYASTVSSLAGLSLGVGYEGEEPIGAIEGLYTDVVSATATVYGVLVGLREREISGRGQGIDVSQWEALLSLVPEPLIEYSMTGQLRVSEGFRHPLLCPHGNYPAKSDPDDETQSGAWVSIATGSDEEWHRLLDALEPYGPPAEGARTWSLADRQANRELIDAWLSGWTSARDVDTIQQHLQSRGVAAFRVANIADVFVDEQLSHRGTWITLEHPLVGSEPMPGTPWHYTDVPVEVTRRAPLLGEHTQEVLQEVLGITPEQYGQLVEAGAIEVGPRPKVTDGAP